MPKKRKQPELPTPAPAAADAPTTTATTTTPTNTTNDAAVTHDQDVEMTDAAAAAPASSLTPSTDDASSSRNCRRRTAYDWWRIEGLYPERPEQWHECHLDLIEKEEACELTADEEREEDEDMDLLITNATKTMRPSESHLAPIPLEIVYTRSEEEVEEAKELIDNPDARETALDEVVHQLDHLPESIRTLIEELLEQHNADDHPLKYCSVEEFHTMIDSRLSPSVGGEYEYVSKLVQQLKEALKSSQQELTNYMKSKELDFNEMGPYLIEQKRIIEELAKQTERLKSFESPLWQSCMAYLRDARKLNLADEFLVMNPIPWKVNQSNEDAAAATPASTAKSSSATHSSPASSIGLDASESKDKDESTAPTADAATTDPSADLDESDDDSELVAEAIEETSRAREVRYEWMRDQIKEYEAEREKVEGKGTLTWMEIHTFLDETTFIGSEVKETIQFLFKQDPFMINAQCPVVDWFGWNCCKDEHDTPLDPTLSSDRKLLRAIDALIDCIIELTDDYLDDRETCLDEHDALLVSAGGLVELVHDIYPRDPHHSKFKKKCPKLVESVEALYEALGGKREMDDDHEQQVGYDEDMDLDEDVAAEEEEGEDQPPLDEQKNEEPEDADEEEDEDDEPAEMVINDEINDTHRATLIKLYGQAKIALLKQSDEHQLIGRNHFLRGAACQLEAAKTDLIIPRRSIEFLIRELAQAWTTGRLTPDYKWSPMYDFDPEAIEAIHHAAEAFLIQQFDTARADMKSIDELLSHEKRKLMTETEEYVYTGTYRPDHTLTTLNLANGYNTGRLSNCNAAFRYMELSLVGSIGEDFKL